MKHSIRFQLFSNSSRRTWLAFVLLALALMPTPTHAARGAPLTTIVVNSLADSAADDGMCTLRKAITSANTNTASSAKHLHTGG